MVYFIVNLTSRAGKSAKIWQIIQQHMEDKQIAYEAYHTQFEGHATQLATMLCEKTTDDICIIVIGGDGTMNEVINGITDFEKVRFGMIPVGSGNDFGDGLGISHDVSENIERLFFCVEQGVDCYKAIDLGLVSWNNGKSQRLFGISSGLGMDAIVCKKALHSKVKKFLNKLHLGKLTYILLTIQTLFSMQTTDCFVEYDVLHDKDEPKRKSFAKVIFMAAMNLSAEGGGVPMAPNASVFDGNLSVASAYKIPKWLTFFYLPLLVAAKHEKLNGFDVVDAKKIHVVLSSPTTLHADGEYLGEVTDVTFVCLPQKLRLLF